MCKKFIAIIFLFVSLMFSACASLKQPQVETQNCLAQQIEKKPKPLSAYLYKTDKKLAPGKSAFYPLALPKDALAARLFLIDHAQKSIDVQYYIYENDAVGSLFSYHLYLAAQRGVKVRILLDDISTTGKDREIVTLAQHKNISLKLFNPNKFRKIFRNLALLLDVNTLGKRMHNKALVVDNYAAIVGGRNIGDVYYASNKETLFLDYDVLVIGSVVPEISRSFMLYWDAKESYKAQDILDNDAKFSLVEIQKSKCTKIKKVKYTPVFKVAQETNLFYDLPSKVTNDENNDTFRISKQISEELKEVKDELIIISPYFIPSPALMQRFKMLREKGVDITIITNSLASTDVFPVYGAYVNYIKPLTQMGINLYELKPTILKKPPVLSLHTKLILVDNKRIAIGSANIDPRSEKLNTELLLIVTSATLTTQEKEYIKQMISLKNFYKLSWGELPKNLFGDGMKYYGPIWTTEQNGREKVYYYPPGASFWKQVGALIVNMLPIEGYL